MSRLCCHSSDDVRHRRLASLKGHTVRATAPARALIAVAIAVGLSLSLTACGDDEAERETSGGAGGESSSTSTEVTESPTENEPDDSDTDPAQPASPTSCLVGTWLADNQQLGALFKSSAAGTDAAGSLSDPTGEVLVTFGPEGQYSVTYDAWTIVMSQDGVTVELIRDGTDEGGYEATDAGTVEWTEATMGSLATMKSPAGTMELAADPSGTSGTFVCEGETLKITAEGSTTAFDRRS